jgi:hypothetical protein
VHVTTTQIELLRHQASRIESAFFGLIENYVQQNHQGNCISRKESLKSVLDLTNNQLNHETR